MLELDWLPKHTNLSSAITAARDVTSPLDRFNAAVAFAGFRRDALATLRIDRLAQGAWDHADSRNGFQRRRLAVMASSTFEHLVPAIRVAALDRRLMLSVDVAPYGQFHQSLLQEHSFLDEVRPDFVLFTLDEAAALAPLPVATTSAEADSVVIAEIDRLRVLWQRTRERYGAVVLQQTVLNTRLPLFGSYETTVPGAPWALIDRFNQKLADAAKEMNVLLVDIDRQAAWSGREAWSDPALWHAAKQTVGPSAAPFYGDIVARIIASACGLSRKCLVLDLDNTIWGGVVGDDGINGLVLGQGSALGEAYLNFQRFAMNLAERGIVLAICSKNDADLVERVFAEHAEMHLKRDRIATVMANWDDKATNLRRIAATLELGIESFVFVDDNPAEREIIRQELPAVAVPEMPDDVAQYGLTIARAGYFEATAFTGEDQIRVRQYAQNARRGEELSQATDMDAFLQSLEMEMEAGRPRPEDIARVTQLINKTNQFNLTTRRYKEPEVAKLVDDPDTIVLRFRLIDRFGDNGLIAVIIARPHTTAAQSFVIETWLMSCRVLGRGVEAACLQVLARAAMQRKATTLLGEYRPSPRNGMVRNHYARLGFQLDQEEQTDVVRWRLELASPIEPTGSFIRINE